MTNWNKDLLEAAHKHSIVNQTGISKSGKCGCFYCLNVFNPDDILEWVDEESLKGATALCPKCDIDSVIGSESGYPVGDNLFLKAMNEYYFKTY